MPTRRDWLCGLAVGTRRGRQGASPYFYPRMDTAWPFDEAIVTIEESALAKNHDLIEAIMNAEVSGPVMTADEFKSWLDQQ